MEPAWRHPAAVRLLCLQSILIQLDAQAGFRRQLDEAVVDRKGLFQVAFAQADLFLAKEIRHAGVDLQAGRQRDGPKRVVRGDRRVVGLRYVGEPDRFLDAAAMARVRLNNGNCLLLEPFAKTPARKKALAYR